MGRRKNKDTETSVFKYVGGEPAHNKTEKIAIEVSALSSFGVPLDDIAIYVGVSVDTIRKYYDKEASDGRIKANAAVAKRLYQSAIIEGNVTSMIFWLKTRAGWKEKSEVVVTDPDGNPVPIVNIYLPDNNRQRSIIEHESPHVKVNLPKKR